jgi:hypothetical protein
MAMADDEVKRLLEAMQQQNADAHAETRRHFDAAASETRRHFDTSVSETRRHFDVAVEQMEKRFDLLAESVTGLKVELLQTRTSLDEKIERSALETQAMIKFSHRELDRRMTALEEAVSDLQSRVERLEGSTH